MPRLVKALLLSLALAAGVAAPAYADRLAQPRMQVFDSDGAPLAGAQMEFYESGTSTPKDTFSDDGLTAANTNPVLADSAGRFGEIFLASGDYKVILKDSGGVTIWTADPVRAPAEDSTVVLGKTTSYTIATSDQGKLIAADATGGAFTVTLPAVATAGDGFEVTVMKVDASSNAVTVDGSGSETINGNSDLSLPDRYSAAVFRTDGTTWYAYAITPGTANRILPPGHINGFGLTNDSTDSAHDIDIATGSARDQDDGGNVLLTTALTKRLDAAFAEGTNQGGLDTGTVAASTTYFVWAIGKADGTADILFSTSSSSPTMPGSFTLKKLLGAVATDGSADIINGRFMTVGVDGREHFRSEQIAVAQPITPLIRTGLTKEIEDLHIVLVCLTANLGYSPGDRVHIQNLGSNFVINLSAQQDNGSRNLEIVNNATNGLFVPQKDNGGLPAPAVEANWAYVVRAVTQP